MQISKKSKLEKRYEFHLRMNELRPSWIDDMNEILTGIEHFKSDYLEPVRAQVTGTDADNIITSGAPVVEGLGYWLHNQYNGVNSAVAQIAEEGDMKGKELDKMLNCLVRVWNVIVESAQLGKEPRDKKGRTLPPSKDRRNWILNVWSLTNNAVEGAINDLEAYMHRVLETRLQMTSAEAMEAAEALEGPGTETETEQVFAMTPRVWD